MSTKSKVSWLYSSLLTWYLSFTFLQWFSSIFISSLRLSISSNSCFSLMEWHLSIEFFKVKSNFCLKQMFSCSRYWEQLMIWDPLFGDLALWVVNMDWILVSYSLLKIYESYYFYGLCDGNGFCMIRKLTVL